jgi:prepilin-type N-terminal cleavage/methylation domain-containing protein
MQDRLSTRGDPGPPRAAARPVRFLLASGPSNRPGAWSALERRGITRKQANGSGHMRKRPAGSGFTLLELMVGVSIFGILLAVSIPPLVRSMDTQGSANQAGALASRLRLARSQSLTACADVVVYFNRDGAGTYTVHVDNGGGNGTPDDANFVAANRNNGQVDANEPVQQPVSVQERLVFGYVVGAKTDGGEFLGAPISFAGTPQRVTFHSDGTASEDGWVSVMPLQDFLDQEAGREYLVEINGTTGEVVFHATDH